MSGSSTSSYTSHPGARSVVRLDDGLELRATIDAADPLLDVFFASYDQVFVLPSEKEDITGFRDCLALNSGPTHERLTARYGPFREFVAVAVNTTESAETVVGGANLVCYPLCMAGGGSILAMNLNYVFVLPAWRQRGYFGRILRACETLVRQAFHVPGDGVSAVALPLVMFFELNDPLQLGQADSMRDAMRAGLDGFQRIDIWARAGARIIDFPYVQPSLSKHQAPEHNLLLAARGITANTLSACLLREHLSRFFATSVLKGADPGTNPHAHAQLQHLDELCSIGAEIPLLDLATHLARSS